MIPLLLLNKVGWKRVAGAGAVTAVILLVAYVRLQHIALKQAELAYHNPRKVLLTRTVKVEGPVRIVTRTVREPGGREEIMREEVRGPVVTTRDMDFRMEPVFPPAPRLDRWLAGARVEPFHYTERHAWAVYGGYSFRNRLDLCAGVSGRGRAEILALVRF
jgi:hypothetical protein